MIFITLCTKLNNNLRYAKLEYFIIHCTKYKEYQKDAKNNVKK